MQKEFLLDLVSWLFILIVLTQSGCSEKIHDVTARGRFGTSETVFSVEATTPSPIERIVVVSGGGSFFVAPKKTGLQAASLPVRSSSIAMSTGDAFPRLMPPESDKPEQRDPVSSMAVRDLTVNPSIHNTSSQGAEPKAEDREPRRLTQLRFDRPEETESEPLTHRAVAPTPATFNEARVQPSGTWMTALIYGLGIVLSAVVGYFLTMRYVEGNQSAAQANKTTAPRDKRPFTRL